MLALYDNKGKRDAPAPSASSPSNTSLLQPHPSNGTTEVGGGGGGTVSDTNGRIVFTAMTMLCVVLLAVLFGSRAHTFWNRTRLRKIAFIRLLVFMLYICAIIFVITVQLMFTGLNLKTEHDCRAAIYICLVFYISCKILVQMFLIERAHAARYMLKQRRDDWMWVTSVVIVLLGFGTIAVTAFIFPLAEFAGKPGSCRIGLPLTVTIPLLTYDILINIALTAVFIALLRPLLQLRNPARAEAAVAQSGHRPRWLLRKPMTTPTTPCHTPADELSSWPVPHAPTIVVVDPNVNKIKNLVYRSLLGTGLVLVPTIVNMGLLFRWRGKEQGWLCFTICTIDVTWSVFIVHFLTVDHREDDGAHARNTRSIESFATHR